MKSNLLNTFLIISFVAVLSCAFFVANKLFLEKEIAPGDLPEIEKEKKETKPHESLPQPADSIELKINEVSDYKKLSKETFYELRKKYVSTSLFASKDYSPSDEVFGGIAGNSPWYGLNYSGCINSVRGNKKVTEGPSEESRFVNNPNMLIGIISGSQQVEPDAPECFDKNYWLLPTSMTYSQKTKTIITTYDFKYVGPMALVGLNAKDFGYKYIYAETPKNYQFTQNPNISEQVFELRDFIHLGGSCGYKNGCNNGSPYQSYLDIEFKDFPAIINLKLWKKMPKTPEKTADFNYRIIFQ